MTPRIHDPKAEHRKFEILHSIVRTFIESGEPVASRSVSKQRRDHLSPASIRNVMADLADEGFLEQPHTSAGRIPTAKAFQSYVQSIEARRASFPEVARMREQLSQLPTMEGRIERASTLLSELSRGVGIAAAIPGASQTLDHVEFVSLDPSRVLIIVVTRDHLVRNRVVMLRDAVTQDELNNIRNYLNREFSGWAVPAVRAELQRRLTVERAAYDEVLRKLTHLYAEGMLDFSLPAVHLDGASNLVGIDLQLTRERLRELFRALEQKERLLELLERFLEAPEGLLAVQVGLAEAHPAMAGLTLIGLNVTLPSGLSTKVAVLGPMRMNYDRVVSAVHQVGEVMQSVAEE
jgi:heat-inducible transcriptional repressor